VVSRLVVLKSRLESVFPGLGLKVLDLLQVDLDFEVLIHSPFYKSTT